MHFPAGSISKDGPSAGVTIITVLVSLLTKRCVRSDVAMTGEVTLNGIVLPVCIPIRYLLVHCRILNVHALFTNEDIIIIDTRYFPLYVLFTKNYWY